MPKTDTIIKDINKHFKKEVLFRASDERFQIQRISTGSIVIDRLLGGGIAKGRFTELFGNYSTLKTYTALKTIAVAQRDGGRAIYCDVERSFDPIWATHIGVEVGTLEIYRPEYGEELIDLAETVLRSKEFTVIVIDSIAALIPQAEIEESAEKAQMGKMGMLTSKMMRRLTTALSTDTAVILINQVREKIGIRFGNPETTTGGRAIPFFAGQRLQFRKGTRIKNKENRTVGYEVNILVEKDKTGPGEGRTGQIVYNIGKGIDTTEELLSLGELDGAIGRQGNTYTYGDKSALGRDKFKKWLIGDKAARKALRKALLNGG